MDRLSQGQLVAAISGVVLIISMFLSWSGVSVPEVPSELGVQTDSAPAIASDTTHNLWDGSTLDIYLTQVNNDLSTIMKRLTGVTVILAGIGAVAGIFGMSEAHVEAGDFWLVTAMILLGAAVAAIVLRRIDWI